MINRSCSALACVAAVCLAMTSCGSDDGGNGAGARDEQAVAAAMKRYLRALGNLDAVGACGSLTAAAQQQVVAQSGSSESTCVDLFRLGFATMGEEQKRALEDQRDLEPFGIEASGTSATGRLRWNSQTSQFSAEKVGGAWKVSSPGEAEIVAEP